MFLVHFWCFLDFLKSGVRHVFNNNKNIISEDSSEDSLDDRSRLRFYYRKWYKVNRVNW